MECSGQHRGLGVGFVISINEQVHLSFVRSVQMDSWSEKEIKAMQVGGNKQLRDFFSSRGVSNKSSIKKKYNSSAAALYREMLSLRSCFNCRIQAKVDGREPPSELPQEIVNSESDEGLECEIG